MKYLLIATKFALFSLALAGLAAVPGAPVPAEEGEEPAAEAPKSPRLSRLQGSAYTGRNRYVVGATVLIRPEDEPSKIYVTSSDSRGRFQVGGLPDGDYRVEVRRDGLETMSKEDVNLKYPFRAVVEFPMQPAGTGVPLNPAGNAGEAGPVSLRGRVVERGGEPIPDITLRLVRADGEVDPRTLKTGPDGAFGVDEFLSGRWGLVASGVGFLPLRTSLRFEADTDLTLSMVRQPADYRPSPLELMPPEQPVPPAGLPD